VASEAARKGKEKEEDWKWEESGSEIRSYE